MSYDVDILNFGDFKKSVSNSTSGYWQSQFGSSAVALYKPFTTNTTVSGYPAYEAIVPLTNNLADADDGYVAATPTGLNPYGISTVGEGVISGSGLHDWNSDIPNRDDVRALGYKTPMTLVGWGFDTMGMPAPNFDPAWNASGALSLSDADANDIQLFIKFDGTTLSSTKGNEVDYYDYKAGPLDVRWDTHRKVWTAYNGGVWAARVTDIQVSGGAVPYNENIAYFSEVITYDAEIYDGVAHSIRVTGINHVGPKPAGESYKIKPVPVGNFCFIVNYPSGDIPNLAIYLAEPLAVEECPDPAPAPLMGAPLMASSVTHTILNPPHSAMVFTDGILTFASGTNVTVT